jgi:hypothetical protein
MNEMMSPAQMSLDLTLPERAQRIRDLVGTARLCIIEVGRELIAAKAQIEHGGWLSWIKTEFGWSQPTASRFMQVAEAFKLFSVNNMAGLTIDATALYALASSDVPQSARDEAVSRAGAGETITKAEADEMVARLSLARVQEAIKTEQAKWLADKEREIAVVRAQIEEARTEARNESSASLETASETLEELQDAYDRLVEERNDLANPSDERLVAMLGKKPSKLRLVALASALNRPVFWQGKEFAPVGEKELTEMRRAKAVADEQLQKLFDPKGPPANWHRALMALRAIVDLPPVQTLFDARYDGFDHAFADVLPKALNWITELSRRMTNAKTVEPAGAPSIRHRRN